MGGEVPVPKNLTPLESAIADQADRRRAYEKRRRDAGHRKMTVWCPGDACDLVRLVCKGLADVDDPTYREMILSPLIEASVAAETAMKWAKDDG